MRLLRKKKILRQANNYTKHKIEILLDKIEENSNLENLVKDYPVSNIGLLLLLLIWANIDMLEDIILVSKSSRITKASIGSSSNS